MQINYIVNMKFADFIKVHQDFIKSANYQFEMNNITFKLLVRIWNSYAILFPEKCEDVWVFVENSNSLKLIDNPLNKKNVNMKENEEETEKKQEKSKHK